MDLEPVAPDEPRYKSEEEYDKDTKTRAELVSQWDRRIQAADRVYQAWARRFKVDILYNYYEGFQWADNEEQLYVINMIYSTIETKLPNLIFNNPQFALRPRPASAEFNFEEVTKETRVKEDVLNYVSSREEFGLNDKHELAILDAFFGFGVVQIDYSGDSVTNPMLKLGDNSPLGKLYCKHIPFDHFRVSARANWDLSEGGWLGYYEFVPRSFLKKYKGQKFKDNSVPDEDEVAAQRITFQITNTGMSNEVQTPAGCVMIWRIWDFNSGKYIEICPDGETESDKLLKQVDFEYCPVATIRFGKRRKGWYPIPPVFNWISPQDEINDIRHAHKLHRKRFVRRYAILEGAVDANEADKFTTLPDGGTFTVLKQDAIKPVEDALQDPTNMQSLVTSYDDMNRITGTSSEARGVSDRTTATQAGIIDRRAQIRESKDLMRVGNFLMSVGRLILRALSKADGSFWALIKMHNEHVMGKLEQMTQQWMMIPPAIFAVENYDIMVNVTSISPVYAQEDKRNFMEFLALLTQYEILAFSPALLREAAYRVGYRNEAVLGQFQQLAQLAAIGRLAQAKQMVAATAPPVPGGPNPGEPGELAQRQTDMSTPPDTQEIMNQIFNRNGLQQGDG